MTGPGVRATVHAGVAMLARSPFAAGQSGLTSGLDDERASALRAAILLDTIDAVLGGGWPLHLFVTPSADRDALGTLVRRDPALAGRASQVAVHPQVDGDLGVRMADAAARTLAAGHDVALVVRPDVPDVPPNALRAAVAAVAGAATGAALAFGPSADGGFYLSATSSAAALSTAFTDITWSAPDVLASVTARAQASGCRVHRVIPWYALDTADDLAALLARAAVTGRASRVRRAAVDVQPA